MLTLHGTLAFFWWLYLAQVALMLGFAGGERSKGLLARPFVTLALATLVGGFGISEYAALTKTPLLYDDNSELGLEDPIAVGAMAGSYLLLALGLAFASFAAIATTLGARDDRDGEMSAMGFGVLAWAGFLIVSSIAAINAFLLNLLWALGVRRRFGVRIRKQSNQ